MRYTLIRAYEFLGRNYEPEFEDLSEFENLNFVFKDEEYESDN